MRRYLQSFAIAIAALFIAFVPLRAEELWKTRAAALAPADRERRCTVNGIQIYYAVWGDGSPLILLRGGLGNTEYFGGQVPEFAKQYKVIAMDSHGRSSRDAQAYSYGLMAKDVVALMDYLMIEKGSIVGWSDGGIIGLDIAMNYPDGSTGSSALAPTRTSPASSPISTTTRSSPNT